MGCCNSTVDVLYDEELYLATSLRKTFELMKDPRFISGPDAIIESPSPTHKIVRGGPLDVHVLDRVLDPKKKTLDYTIKVGPDLTKPVLQYEEHCTFKRAADGKGCVLDRLDEECECGADGEYLKQVEAEEERVDAQPQPRAEQRENRG